MNPTIPVLFADMNKAFEKAEKNNKPGYAQHLSNPNEDAREFAFHLKDISAGVLQALYFALRNKFTPKCSNEERIQIINSLLGAPQDQWQTIVQQVCFIMPVGSRGHDVMWATKVLATITVPEFRSQLVNSANRLFTYDTITVERGYILEALSKMTSAELVEIDNADAEKRTAFIARTVPDFKDQKKVVYRYDFVAEEGFDV